ncbi:hypothetical protein AHiyo1_41540 [Arthrobacter sp. Hiyo1]|nr:hypothetical protein AHiyo1_41540 [Arthrobacter sp. Hiyo1]
MLLGAQHGMAQALRFALPHIVDRPEPGGMLHRVQASFVAFQLQRAFKIRCTIKVVFKGALVAACNHQHVAEARLHGLLNHVLDGRLIHHRQHFLRHRLGGRQETRAQSGRRNNCFTN